MQFNKLWKFGPKILVLAVFVLPSFSFAQGWDSALHSVDSVNTYSGFGFVEVVISPPITVMSSDENNIIRLYLDTETSEEAQRYYSTFITALTADLPVTLLVSACVDVGNGTTRPDINGVALKRPVN